MKGIYRHEWLQSFFSDPLPSSDAVAEGLMRHSFEVEEVRGSGDEAVYVLDILPDRANDCLAHYGIAKELSAIFSLPLAERYFSEPFVFSRSADCIHTDTCDRYAMLRFSGLSVPDSLALTMRSRLEGIGQRSVSPLVDLSNYILFDIGQPVHVFDARKVSGSFGVRRAREGETFVLLSGETVSLTPEDTVIADGDRAIALAGVKGGLDTGVDGDTADVFVEIGSFSSAAVRRSMRRLGLSSAAAQRFSQGLSPESVTYTAQRAATLFSSCGDLTDSFDCRRVTLSRIRKTGVSVSEVNALLGTSYPEQVIADAFDRLGFAYEIVTPRERFVSAAGEQVGKPYRWGASVARDAPDSFDCSSLVSWCAAQAGLSVPRISINQCLSSESVSDPVSGDLVFSVSGDAEARTESVFEAGCPVSPGSVEGGISHVGIVDGDEVIEASGGDVGRVQRVPLSSFGTVRAGRIFSDERRFVVSVPVERSDLRDGTDLIEEVARIVGYDAVPVSELPLSAPAGVNSAYAKRLAVISALRDLGFSEVLSHSFRSKGDVCVSYPVAKDKGCLRTDLRTAMVHALEKNTHNGELLGLDAVRLVEIGSVFTSKGEEVRMALGISPLPGRPSVSVAASEEEIRSVLSLPGSFENGVWEVPFSSVTIPVSGYQFLPPVGEVRYAAPSRYPFVLRDIALFVPDGTDSASVSSLISGSGGPFLRRVNLFDSFEKDGRLSYAFRLVFQSDTGTLTDGEVLRYMGAIESAVGESGCEVR